MDQAIFVVDGDFDIQCALGEAFEEEGWRPLLFRGAEEALEALERADPWFMVLDLRLPRMSGDEMLLALAGKPGWSRFPLAVFTAWNDVAVAERLNVPVVRKPHFAALLDLLRAVASGGHGVPSGGPAPEVPPVEGAALSTSHVLRATRAGATR